MSTPCQGPISYLAPPPSPSCPGLCQAPSGRIRIEKAARVGGAEFDSPPHPCVTSPLLPWANLTTCCEDSWAIGSLTSTPRSNLPRCLQAPSPPLPHPPPALSCHPSSLGNHKTPPFPASAPCSPLAARVTSAKGTPVCAPRSPLKTRQCLPLLRRGGGQDPSCWSGGGMRQPCPPHAHHHARPLWASARPPLCPSHGCMPRATGPLHTQFCSLGTPSLPVLPS